MASDAKPLSAEEIARWREAMPNPFMQQMFATIDAQAAKIAELEAEIKTDDELLATRDALLNEFPCPTHGPCVPYLRKRLQLLARAVEAMRRVPHLYSAQSDDEILYRYKECFDTDECARLGGACAFKALIEEIERNG